MRRRRFGRVWRRAALATAGLIRAWFDAGVDVVITHGPFFEPGGFEILRHAQPADVDVHHILLRVTAEVAITRVQSDPARGISKDPTFVRDSNTRLRAVNDLLPVMNLELDTTQRGPDEIAFDVMAAVIPPTKHTSLPITHR